MLIVPLHRKLTRDSFPLLTALLILANVAVYAGLQSGDHARRERAVEYYLGAGLARYELPVYLDHLERTGRREQADALRELPGEFQGQLTALLVQSDPDFVAALRGDRIITADAADYATWKPLRTQFDRLWGEGITDRFVLRYGEIAPERMLGSMFLHGNAAHLIGNMAFLALLGLLVEAALGRWRFLALYLLSGLGAAAFALAWRWHDTGAMLGASGAIAGLMGAYCVLWGRRKVRFFYWFFFVFDYVRAPALLLLPLWLGWELYNLFANGEAGIGFDAHAGGMITGALLAWAAVALRWTRRDVLDEEDVREQDQALYDRGMAELGRSNPIVARAAFAELARRRPDDIDALEAAYRAWRNEPAAPGFHGAARQLLTAAVVGDGAGARQKALFDDYLALTNNRPRLTANDLLALARRWLDLGFADDAQRLLRSLLTRSPELSGLSEACFRLALLRRDQHDVDGMRRWLQLVRKRFAQSREALKAQALLDADVRFDGADLQVRRIPGHVPRT